MKKYIIILTCVISFLGVLPTFATGTNFSDTLNKTISGMNTIETSYQGSDGTNAEAVNGVISAVIKNILLPLIVFFGIANAIFGFYKMITSSSDDAKKKGMNHIIRGVVGIIVIVSANFLASELLGTGVGGVFMDSNGHILAGPQIANNLYTKILYPFVKFLMYFIMAGLFLVAMIRAISLLTNDKEDGAKQAGSIIKRNAFGLLVIIFSKAIIEAVYGKEQQVLNNTATNLSSIGSTVDKSIPFVYTIINYFMGFIGIFLLIMIIIQAIQILTKPTDEAMQKKLRKNITYILIGLVVMGLSYVITNVFIIK